MSYRSPARPKAERSSVVLALNDLKKATGGNVGKQMVSLPSRPVPLATRQSRISNASVNSNGSVKPRKSTTTINRMSKGFYERFGYFSLIIVLKIYCFYCKQKAVAMFRNSRRKGLLRLKHTTQLDFRRTSLRFKPILCQLQ